MKLYLSLEVVPDFASALGARLRGLRLHLDFQGAGIDWPIELVIVVVVVGFAQLRHRALVESDVGMVSAEVPNHAGSVAALGPDGEVANVASGAAELLQPSDRQPRLLERDTDNKKAQTRQS